MADEPNEIKHHIDSTRRELNGNLHELEERVKEATNWHTYVNRYPFTVVGLAFAGGVAVSLLAKSAHTTSVPSVASMRSHQAHPLGRKATELWEGIRDAMLGLAAHQITGLLGDAIPGFRQHYERVERQKAADWQQPVH